MRIEYHRTLIADKARNDALYRALKDAIVPGKSVVVDIGTGTGLLGMFAAKLGARDVHMFETAAVAGVAAKLVKDNKLKNCHVIPCHSTEFSDAIAADVLISETLGNYAFEENIIDTLADARRRFLKPGGTLIPLSVAQRVAPVVSPRIHDELSAWDVVGRGLDLKVAKEMSFNNVYVRALKSRDLLDGSVDGAVWDTVDLTREANANRKGQADWTLAAPATVYGFAVWWDTLLSPGNSLSTGPGAPKTHWEQLYFPLLVPIDAKAGDRVSVQLKSRSSEEGGTHLAWTAIHGNAKGKQVSRAAHNLDKGYLP
jgi:type I protein arginine methyltransferase